MTARLLPLALALVLVAACDRQAAEPPPARTAPPLTLPAANPHGGNPHAMPQPSPAGSRSLSWSDPVGWRRAPPSSPMRVAQYTVPAAPGHDPAELTISHFPGMGGAVQANLDRWYGQFEVVDGGPSMEGARREERDVNGLRATIARARGRFRSGMPGADPAPREDQALLGAIVETPEGPWFFKLTGDYATVAAAAPRFDDLLRSIHRQ